MKAFLIVATAFVSSIFLSSCVGGSNVSMARYSLTYDVNSEALSLKNDVNVKLYGSLNENAVVIQLSPVEIRPALNHLWEGKLSDQLALIMKDLMLKKRIDHDVSADIYVAKFYGSVSGKVTIDAFFYFSQEKKVLMRKNFSFQDYQNQIGYTALVEKLKKGWTDLCSKALNELQVGWN